MIQEIRNYIAASDDESDEVRDETEKLVEALEKRKRKNKKKSPIVSKTTSRTVRKKTAQRKGKAQVTDEDDNGGGFLTPKKVGPAGGSSEELIEYALSQTHALSTMKATELRRICDQEGVKWIITRWAEHIRCSKTGGVGNAPKLNSWLRFYGWNKYIVLPLVTGVEDGLVVERSMIHRFSSVLNTIGCVRTRPKKRRKGRQRGKKDDRDGGIVLFRYEAKSYASLTDLLDSIKGKQEVRLTSEAGRVWVGSWKKLREKYGQTYILIGQTRKKLWEAKRDLEASCVFRIVNLVATSTSTQRNKRFLRDTLMQPWRVRTMYKLSSRKLVAFYRTAGLFSSNTTRNCLKNQISRVLKQKFGVEVRRRLYVKFPYSVQVNQSAVRDLMTKVITISVPDEAIRTLVIERMRMVKTKGRTVANIIHNYKKKLQNGEEGCTCSTLSLQRFQGHVRTRLEEVRGVHRFVLNSRNVTCGRAVNTLELLEAIIKVIPKTWRNNLLQLSDADVRRCVNEQMALPSALTEQEVARNVRDIHSLVLVPLDRNPGATLVICPVLYFHGFRMTFSWNPGFVNKTQKEERVLAESKAAYKEAGLLHGTPDPRYSVDRSPCAAQGLLGISPHSGGPEVRLGKRRRGTVSHATGSVVGPGVTPISPFAGVLGASPPGVAGVRDAAAYGGVYGGPLLPRRLDYAATIPLAPAWSHVVVPPCPTGRGSLSRDRSDAWRCPTVSRPGVVGAAAGSFAVPPQAPFVAPDSTPLVDDVDSSAAVGGTPCSGGNSIVCVCVRDACRRRLYALRDAMAGVRDHRGPVSDVIDRLLHWSLPAIHAEFGVEVANVISSSLPSRVCSRDFTLRYMPGDSGVDYGQGGSQGSASGGLGESHDGSQNSFPSSRRASQRSDRGRDTTCSAGHCTPTPARPQTWWDSWEGLCKLTFVCGKKCKWMKHTTLVTMNVHQSRVMQQLFHATVTAGVTFTLLDNFCVSLGMCSVHKPTFYKFMRIEPGGAERWNAKVVRQGIKYCELVIDIVMRRGEPVTLMVDGRYDSARGAQHCTVTAMEYGTRLVVGVHTFRPKIEGKASNALEVPALVQLLRGLMEKGLKIRCVVSDDCAALGPQLRAMNIEWPKDCHHKIKNIRKHFHSMLQLKEAKKVSNPHECVSEAQFMQLTNKRLKEALEQRFGSDILTPAEERMMKSDFVAVVMRKMYPYGSMSNARALETDLDGLTEYHAHEVGIWFLRACQLYSEEDGDADSLHVDIMLVANHWAGDHLGCVDGREVLCEKH
ncbi:hypothetical protein CBR_g39882 [Chara braunii]|uniref:Uncharacterized protein n=1 Tax=Chara braunii TaxID=69332 RepID=A0A388LSS9_CHABU|nr:hypothetical protein CBR_g39882 [Chara braunii]|eukprot:GBG85315.1 hypothetical protein CBR_g39882 [Chara braunii]